MKNNRITLAFGLAALLLALPSCSSWKKTAKDYDYFITHPIPTKEQMAQVGNPNAKAGEAVEHSQKILDSVANYDTPITEPMPRGEGGLIAEGVLKPTAKDPSLQGTIVHTDQNGSEDEMPAPVPKPAKSAAKSGGKKDAGSHGDVDANAMALKQMLEGGAKPAAVGMDETDANSDMAGGASLDSMDATDPNAPRQVEINFNNSSLRAVIEFIFGEYIKKPYVIATDFPDKEVNWVAQGTFTNSEVRRMFEAFLDIQGVVVSQLDGVYTVAAKGSAPKIPGGGDMGTAAGIWRLRSIDAAEAMQIVRPFVQNPEGIMLLDKKNTLIVNGSGSEIRYIDTFLRSIDVSNLKDRRILVYSPRNMSAEAMVTLLQALPQQLGLNASEGRKQIETSIITGAKRVVIVTDGQETRDVVMQYINQIDQPGKKQKQVFYYNLRNQVVDDVRTVLTSLLPGILPETTDIVVVANAPTNALVITATPDQYFEIKKVIDRLDYRVPSVMIDATIVEVQLNDNLAYGVEWFLGGRAGNVRGDFTTSLQNATAIPNPSARIGVISLANNTFATLDLLASETSLRVLSRPRVIVKNKATATIKSTDQVRIVKSVLTTTAQQSGSNLPQREFEDKEVGVSLQVTPRIAEDGTVNMAVKIQDSRQGATDSSSGEPQPTFNIREVNTELVTKNGETLMIGGLIRNSVGRVKSKVPVLGDIPFFGQAFANSSDSDQRTELVIFMTPYLVVDEISARLVSESLAGLAHLNPDLLAKDKVPDPDLRSATDTASEAAAKEKIKNPPPKAMTPPPAPKILDEPLESSKSESKPLSPDAALTPPPPNVPPVAMPDEPAPMPKANRDSDGGYIYSSPDSSLPPTLAPDQPPSPVPDSRDMKNNSQPLLQ